MTPLARWLCLAALLFTTLSPITFAQSINRRSESASNLRQIGHACLIYAQSNKDQFPRATDIWDYARLLAEDGGLEIANIWTTHSDPARSRLAPDTTVLLPGTARPRALNPDFRKLKPAFAVALGKLNANKPATTPIAWTRGLQPDGTWAPHSPFGTAGGHIVFVGGNVAFFKNLGATAATGELTRYDGQGPTNNILDALPPGTRISEYVPTPAEQAAWAVADRNVSVPSCCIRSDVSPLSLSLFLGLPFFGISIHRMLQDRPGAFTILIWPLLLTILVFLIVPTVS